MIHEATGTQESMRSRYPPQMKHNNPGPLAMLIFRHPKTPEPDGHMWVTCKLAPVEDRAKVGIRNKLVAKSDLSFYAFMFMGWFF